MDHRGKRKGQRIGIREIVSKDDGSTPSAEVLMKGLEQNVRKVLEKKRQEFDKLSFQVKAKQAQVEKLKVQLIEVERDSEALGITKEPNPQRRLKSNKQVSTRKLYLDDSRIETLVRQLEDQNVAIQKVEMKGKIYQHMLHRLRDERVVDQKQNTDLTEILSHAKGRVAALEQECISSAEAFSKTQRRLDNLNKEVAEDLELWQKEIFGRKQYADQREKFAKFVQTQIAKQRELEDNGGAEDASKARERKLKMKHAATMFQMRHHQRKLSVSLEDLQAEEERYQDAFRRIGIKLEGMDPQSVIRTCIHQDEMRRELLRKRSTEEARVESLKRQKAQLQAQLQHTMFEQQRTTNRLLSEREKRLNDAEKRLEAERAEYTFMMEAVQPVKIGLQHLARKVLGVKADLASVEEVEKLMEKLQSKLAQIMDEMRQAQAAVGETPGLTASKSTASLASYGKGALPGESALRTMEAVMSPSGELPPWLMSEHNVRVKPQRTESDSDDDDELPPVDAGSTRNRRRGTGRGATALGGLSRREDSRGGMAGGLGLGVSMGMGMGGGDSPHSDDDSEEDAVINRHELKMVSQEKVMKETRRMRRALKTIGDQEESKAGGSGR